MTRARAALSFALVSIVAVAAYQGGLDNPFVYDDHHAILENEFIQHPRHLTRFLMGDVASTGAFPGHFRPLPMATLYLNHAAGGLAPWGYRAVNLVLHLGCALVAYFLVRRLLAAFGRLEESRARLGAMAAAALLALHPLHSLAVLLVWKRTTLLASLFYLVAVFAFVGLRGIGGLAPRSRLAQGGLAALVLVSFALSFSSKETAVTLPAVLLILELWPRPEREPWTARRLALTAALQLPMWVGVVLSLTVLFPSRVAEAADADRLAYLLTQAKALWLYAAMAVAPNLLSAAYDLEVPASALDPSALAGGLALAALLVAAVLCSRRFPFASFAVVWALVTVSPTSSFVPNPLLVDEDRVYLPFLLLWAIAGAGLARLAHGARAGRWVALGAAVAVLGGCAFATAARCITWNEVPWVWIDALEKYPGAGVAKVNLCAALSGSPERAREAAGVCRAAVSSTPKSGVARSGLVRALVGLGRISEAGREVEEGLRLAPEEPNLLVVAGHLAWASEEPARAARYYQRALRRNPWSVEALLYLAKCLQELGRLDDARRAMVYLRGRPIADRVSRALLADLHRELGDLDGAEAILRSLRAERPSDADPLVGLALVAAARADRAGAGVLLAEAERLATAEPAHLMKIARAELARGAPREAAALFERVAAARPRAVLPRAELARALLAGGRKAEACALVVRLRPEVGAEPAAARLLGELERSCAR
jgi:tetratricopeptide (TPR) repeat protein